MKSEHIEAAKHVIEKVFCVRPGEHVLIITDTLKAEFAQPFMAAAVAVGAEVITLTMVPRQYPGERLPEPINVAMRAADVVIGCVSRSIAAPIWENIAWHESVKTRGASISEISDAVMEAGGLLADPAEVMHVVNGVYEAAVNTKEWRLTTPAGTDLTAKVASCRIVERQPISRPRMGGVLPGCEVALDPVPGTAAGVFVSDGSCGVLDPIRLGYEGTLNERISCVVAGGMITQIVGGNEARLLKEILESIRQPCAYALSHLAIGCNPRLSHLTGHYIQDEKVLGGVHIAHAGTKGCRSGNIDHCLQHPSLWLDDVKVIDDSRFIGPLAHLQPASR